MTVISKVPGACPAAHQDQLVSSWIRRESSQESHPLGFTVHRYPTFGLTPSRFIPVCPSSSCWSTRARSCSSSSTTAITPAAGAVLPHLGSAEIWGQGTGNVDEEKYYLAKYPPPGKALHSVRWGVLLLSNGERDFCWPRGSRKSGSSVLSASTQNLHPKTHGPTSSLSWPWLQQKQPVKAVHSASFAVQP